MSSLPRRPRTNSLMRIVSLVPSATEMLFALGLGPDVVAVTHECDYPPAALELPQVTRDVLPAGPQRRRRSTRPSRSARWPASRSTSSTPTRSHDLEPDLIVTQALCSVCAVSYDDVRAIAEQLDPPAAGDLARPAHARRGARRRAHARRRRPTARMPPSTSSATRRTGSTGSGSPSAGARDARGGRAGVARPAVRGGPLDPAADRVRRRRGRARVRRASTPQERTWEEVAAAQPDVVIVMPCGYDAEIAHREAEMHRDAARGARRRRGRGRRRRRLLLAARARGSSTASSCSRTSCTPSCSPRRHRQRRSPSSS